MPRLAPGSLSYSVEHCVWGTRGDGKGGYEQNWGALDQGWTSKASRSYHVSDLRLCTVGWEMTRVNTISPLKFWG